MKKAAVPKKAEESKKAPVPKKAEISKKAAVPKKVVEGKKKIPVKEVHEPETAKSPELKTAEEEPKTAESSHQMLSKMNPMIQIKTGSLCDEKYTDEQIKVLEPGDTLTLEKNMYVWRIF